MAFRQNQVIAIEKNVKARANREVSEIYKLAQKPELFAGLSRNYRPKDENGDKLPSEFKKVQKTVRDLNTSFRDALIELFNVTATKDATNCIAKADVVVDGQTLATNVPATYLLFLEKQLTDIHTFISKLPTLDPTEVWKVNEATGLYATEPVETTKTKKVMKNHVKAAATDKHPAQVEIFTEDELVGYYSLTKFSGAIPAPVQAQMLAKVEKLQKAVKAAREEANTITATELAPGKAILDYIFG